MGTFTLGIRSDISFVAEEFKRKQSVAFLLYILAFIFFFFPFISFIIHIYFIVQLIAVGFAFFLIILSFILYFIADKVRESTPHEATAEASQEAVDRITANMLEEEIHRKAVPSRAA